MDLTEPEPQFRIRRRKTITTSIFRTFLSALAISLISLIIYFTYIRLEPIGAFQLILIVLEGSLLTGLAGFIFYWNSWILTELRRLKPISVSGNRITLNTRFTVDIDDIQGIDRHSQWKELRFRLTDKKTVIIIMENKFVSDLLENYKKKWSIWDYKDNDDFVLP